MKLLSVIALLFQLTLNLQADDRKPNVLFIAVDDLRPDLGCYGNKIIATPNIDRLAARGMIFNHAYCQQAVCSPSRSSLMTGKRPDANRVWDLETHFRVALPDCVTLPQFFKSHGYHCAALSKVYHRGFEDGRSWSEPHWYPNGTSVDTDSVDWTVQIKTRHDVNVSEYSTPAAKVEGGKAGKSGKAGPAYEVSAKTDAQLPDGATALEAVKRLHDLKNKDAPFFLAVGFLKPHLPFVAPKDTGISTILSAFPFRRSIIFLKGRLDSLGHDNGELHAYPGVPAGNPIPLDFAKKLRHGYYAAISYTDAQIGLLLDELDREGLADNTVVVLWGDHGWQLGEHGLWTKHTNFEAATRAPLIISAPHQKTAGRKCDATVEFVDVYPTLADICGLPAPGGIDGRSLKPFLENADAPAVKCAISQYPRSTGKAGVAVMGYSIRDDRWRLTLWRETMGSKIIARELYDEKNDPDETKNLADNPEHSGVIESLTKNLPPVMTSPAVPKAKAGPPAAADRGTRFDNMDKRDPGKLSRDEFMKRQSDADEGRKRFDKWDLNRDGFLSREEYTGTGASGGGSE